MSTFVESDAKAPANAAVRSVPLTGWAISGTQLLTVFGFCVLFLYHNYLPLFHSDLWGHVAYGDWILRHGMLPQEDPFVELAAGVPVVDNAWLGQIILAWAGRGSDVEWLGHLFAVVVLATYVILAMSAYRRTGRWGLAAACSGLAFIVAWSRHAVQRPEIFGQLCFAGLLWLIVRDGFFDSAAVHRKVRRWWTFPAVLGLFALWANLHGSFIVGFGVWGAIAAGCAIDQWLLTGHLLAAFTDRRVHRSLALFELAVMGVCLNPYGFDLLVQTVAFPTHPNLKSVMEWFPLEMVSLEGIPMAFSWGLTAVVLRHSQRRMSASEVLLLVLFNVAVCLRVRMIAWYAPMLAVVLAPHLAEIFGRWNENPGRIAAWFGRRSIRLTASAALFIWVTFAFSPISRPVLGGKPRRTTQVFSHQTPLGATLWLQKHPPTGLIFAPQWWGDWLAWRGPDTLRVMVTTNAIHLVPRRVWQDYLCISSAESGWPDRLDRYRINTVLVSRDLQTDLLTVLEQSAGWTIAYEDSISAIFVRKSLQPTADDSIDGRVATREMSP